MSACYDYVHQCTYKLSRALGNRIDKKQVEIFLMNSNLLKFA